jgi:hypothetical protein
MKQFLLSSLLLISVATFSQDKKQCAETTKAGHQCTRKTEGTYCKQHDPSTPKCIETAKSTGKRCTRAVKNEGDKCFQHNKSTVYLYNAYDSTADEYYVIKSYDSLALGAIVNVDNKAVVTSRKNGFPAKVLSPYTSIH